MEEKLIQVLKTQYGLENVSVDFLREGGCKTYIVNGEKKYLLKMIGNAFKDTAKQSVMIMRYLERKGFPVRRQKPANPPCGLESKGRRPGCRAAARIRRHAASRSLCFRAARRARAGRPQAR